MLNRALSIIQDEHRTFAAVLHGLRFLVREIVEKNTAPDFKLLWSMVYYLDAFSERLHNPREDVYLFARLKQRTHEADAVIATLEEQHRKSCIQNHQIKLALGQLEAGVPDSQEAFTAASEKLVEDAWAHMSLEEKFIIPLARQHLTAEDWVAIADAFGEQGDPRFGAKPEHEFRDLFSRIVNLAPPPIGVGPAR